MPKARANNLDIEYEIYGAATLEPVLMIMGHSGQISGPTALSAELNRRGYRLIVYDNRDIGLSTKLENAPVPDMAKMAELIKLRQPLADVVAYTIDDMATDAVALLDAIGIPAAHIVGGSMGGMIAHLVAADHPGHVLSLTSIASTSGNPDLPAPSMGGGPGLELPDGADIEAAIEYSFQVASLLANNAKHRTPLPLLRERIARQVRRCYYPAGLARQAAAAATYGDRRSALRRIKAPTVVVTGSEDPTFSVDFGRDIAANIPGAEFRVIEGMGHEFPDEVAPLLADAVEAAARRGHPRFGQA